MRLLLGGILLACLSLSSCAQLESTPAEGSIQLETGPSPAVAAGADFAEVVPGELVTYRTHAGDTLSALAARFSTDVPSILDLNPQIPKDATTMPAGFSLEIPAYLHPLTAERMDLLPDSEFVNGPSAVAFDLREEVMSSAGYLADYSDYAYRVERPGWEVVQQIATNYSIHPRLLLALLEHQTNALSNPFPDDREYTYPLGFENERYQGLFRQLLWAAEQLSDGYYGWRTGEMLEFETIDGLLIRPNPAQNPATVAIQYLYAQMYDATAYESQLAENGLGATYQDLWGDPWSFEQDVMPENLQQPPLNLPFEPHKIWDFTGGPHFSWGTSLPWGALDFAPPAVQGGCAPSGEWIAAPADGVIARSEEAIVVLDLDGDGDERTGWVLFFFHLGNNHRIQQGEVVVQGDLLGHPSCEGGRSTGTHVHIARRYNGEWIPAYGPLAFNLDGWVAEKGAELYEGSLVKGSKVVSASTETTEQNRIFYEFP
jgi:murein DD-endopeptidase MepM/ murein hydrolase activator NlpD